MTTFSIYIPRMSVKHDEEFVRHIFGLFRIGMVSRVDFTPINKKPGFVENVDSIWKSAFVHLHEIHLIEPTVPANSDEPEYEYNKEAWESISSGNSYKIQVSPFEYWICLKNKKQVQKSLMNIHQVVENGRHLENLVQQQAKMLEQQAKMLEQQAEKLKAVEDVVYYLLGGLFNQRTQEETLDHLLYTLYPHHGEVKEKYPYTSKWTMWPTTRQGDECEERIATLEKMFGIDNDTEEQDTALLAKKQSRKKFSVAVSSEDDDERMVEEELERMRAWSEEDRYERLQAEAAADRAADDMW